MFFFIFRKKLGWSNKLTGCLILTAGLGNNLLSVFGDTGTLRL
ncbi:hypothetical protein QW060_23585 [Myroides ceti]|uniref:Uncharacterized protein n=1 Tax=Paenimyroides ceti TaxID=395087 RepID=A0ABT8D3Z2_9FLAO|nr:hypothetical protein [Paenimyroides ceti]MDN3709899.1 hypothetical protein [Paenimyroides ceti]